MPPRKRPDISPAPPRRRQGRGPYTGRRSGLPDATSPSPGPASPLPRSRGKTAVQGPCGRLAGSAHGAFGGIGGVGRRQFPFRPGARRRTGRRPGQPEPEKSGRARRLSWRFPPRSVGGSGVGGRTAAGPRWRAGELAPGGADRRPCSTLTPPPGLCGTPGSTNPRRRRPSPWSATPSRKASRPGRRRKPRRQDRVGDRQARDASDSAGVWRVGRHSRRCGSAPQTTSLTAAPPRAPPERAKKIRPGGGKPPEPPKR